MPRKVQSKDDRDGDDIPASKKPKAPPKKRGGREMPPPLPSGVVLTDRAKGRWVLGTSVGKGGFGEIYLAAPEGSSPTLANAKHVVKIEPIENGPLFTELSFYQRAAKPQCISDWVKKKGLDFLGVPKYIGSGSHTHESRQFRFMVMERYGSDLQKVFVEGGKKFSLKTICYLALRLLEALEYLHENEYVHADIKASNIVMGHEAKHEICLVDYGLAYRYCPEGVHKVYKKDPKKKHDGTIEFTSIDAHEGANPSRRGDLEILGYCLLQWGCGQLPWEGFLTDKDKVAQMKMKYQDDIDGLITACFATSPPTPPCLKEYFHYVYKLGYEEKPDYTMLKGLFRRTLKTSGLSDDHSGLDWVTVTPGKKRKSPDVITSPFGKAKRRQLEEEVDEDDEGSQTKPIKARGVRKQAVTKKTSSSKGKKHSLEEDEEGAPIKKAKQDSDSTDREPCIDQDKPTAVRKPTKKKSPAEKECTSNDVVNGDEKEEVCPGSKDSLTEECTEAKATKRPRAVTKKVTSQQPDTSNKIPQVAYPASLGYVSGPGNSSQDSSTEPKEKEETVRPKRSRRINPTI